MTAALARSPPSSLTIITFHDRERDDDRASAAACPSAKLCNEEVRNYGDVRGNAEFEKCDLALSVERFFPPLPPSLPRPTITHGMTKTAPEPAHAPARLRSQRPIWKVKVASAVARRLRSLGREARASLARGPHTISLGDRPTDRPTGRPSFASSFRKAVDKEKRETRSARRRGSPSPSSVWSSHTGFALRRRAASDKTTK